MNYIKQLNEFHFKIDLKPTFVHAMLAMVYVDRH